MERGRVHPIVNIVLHMYKWNIRNGVTWILQKQVQNYCTV